MAIVLDTTQEIRGFADLRRLVEAVRGADEHDEADWIEWKSTLDLTSKEGCFHVARAILGMANRLPERAAVSCGGLGFVVVGAQPGDLSGVVSVDMANLGPVIESYVGGAEGPRWTPTYVPIEDKLVLVVTVEAPRPGDRIHVLRREFTGTRSGAVFVRKPGRTEPADASDHDALQARLTDVAPPKGEVEITLVGDIPVSWMDFPTLDDVIGTWVAKEQDRMISAARATEDRRQATRKLPGANTLGGVLEAAATLQRQSLDYLTSGQPDGRTLEQYIGQVEHWGQAVNEVGRAVILQKYWTARHGLVAVSVDNPTARFLSDVEVQVHFEGDRVAARQWEDDPEPVKLPGRPRPFGQPEPPGFPGGFDISKAMISKLTPPPFPPAVRHTRVEEGPSVRFHVGDLRQRGNDVSDDVSLLVAARPEDGMLHLAWQATIRDQEGVLEGSASVPLAEEAVSVEAILIEADREAQF